MTLTRKQLTLLALLGSAGLLLGALYFQYVRDLAPCKLCYWQRYGHVGALVFGALALALPSRALLALGGLAAASSSAVAVYHSGVERHWWEGLQSCSAPSLTGLTPEQALEAIMNAPLVACDSIPWSLFGLSMANYNIAASAAVAALFVLAIRATR
ncbi:disulfide bond formation protein B [Maliponia aquimaris]|uniref:Disulfide bond formation protein B n=1 Tax=Maliponia aquimaris TaxID=1673631 RepID=A0A238JZ40_9RHOB|nr:disulfide bond formation protein B [Maliponia aquimaris]SMX35918.1 disulfide bond formation protein B [Maliponia aquimaris]